MGLNANDETAKVEAFKIINEFLSDRTTLGGNRITEADRDMFEAIFKSYSTLTYADKEAFLNVSRWISFLQSDEEILGSRSKILFSRSRLYK